MQLFICAWFKALQTETLAANYHTVHDVMAAAIRIESVFETTFQRYHYRSQQISQSYRVPQTSPNRPCPFNRRATQPIQTFPSFAIKPPVHLCFKHPSILHQVKLSGKLRTLRFQSNNY